MCLIVRKREHFIYQTLIEKVVVIGWLSRNCIEIRLYDILICDLSNSTLRNQIEVIGQNCWEHKIFHIFTYTCNGYRISRNYSESKMQHFYILKIEHQILARRNFNDFYYIISKQDVFLAILHNFSELKCLANNVKIDPC